jgi:hypothetical protein
VSDPTRYRQLRQPGHPHAVGRSDRGVPRVLPTTTLERYLAVMAAVKLRTSHRQGRHVSTPEAIRLLEDSGLETPAGVVQAPKGRLKTSPVNAYVKPGGLDGRTLRREPPAVRFQAQHSNALWPFDIRPSDLKHLKAPAGIDASRGQPTLLRYRVVDDRRGVASPEYHGTDGEAVEAALPFLCNARAPKADERFPCGGRPRALSLENGPVARSHVFQPVMSSLDREFRPHLPSGHAGRRPTARSNGKVERPCRTVKEAHATVYPFHEPQRETAAKAWLCTYLLRDNDQPHRAASQSRMEDWQLHLPPEGLREMCSWERCCTCARAPAPRKVAVDAHVSVAGVRYEVDPDLAGETVIVWFGLYDDQLYVEHGERRDGPYAPSGGPIPRPHYRRFKKTRSQQRADRIEGLAADLAVPR